MQNLVKKELTNKNGKRRSTSAALGSPGHASTR
jgi:hypothetical protein